MQFFIIITVPVSTHIFESFQFQFLKDYFLHHLIISFKSVLKTVRLLFNVSVTVPLCYVLSFAKFNIYPTIFKRLLPELQIAFLHR